MAGLKGSRLDWVFSMQWRAHENNVKYVLSLLIWWGPDGHMGGVHVLEDKPTLKATKVPPHQKLKWRTILSNGETHFERNFVFEDSVHFCDCLPSPDLVKLVPIYRKTHKLDCHSIHSDVSALWLHATQRTPTDILNPQWNITGCLRCMDQPIC